jgi:hypothetical protein
MIAAVFEALREEGYRPRLYWPEPDDPARPITPAPQLLVDSDEPLTPELRESIKAHRDALKAVLLLASPPPWLVRLLNLYAAGQELLVKRSSPAAKAEAYPARLTLENISAAVAAAIGLDASEIVDELGGMTEHVRNAVLPEVEARMRTWEPGKVIPFIPGEDEPSSAPGRTEEEWNEWRRERRREDALVKREGRPIQRRYDQLCEVVQRGLEEEA